MPATLFLAQVTLAAASAVQGGEQAVSIAAVGHIAMWHLLPQGEARAAQRRREGALRGNQALSEGRRRVFGNLTAPLSGRGATRKKVDGVNVFTFRTPASYGQWLKDAGFNVLNAANNHILDFGLSLVLQAKLDKHGTLLEAKAVPVKVIEPGVPVPEPDPLSAALAYLGKVSLEDFPETAPLFLSDGHIKERDGPPHQAGASSPEGRGD